VGHARSFDQEEKGMTAAIDIVKAFFDRWDAIDQVYSSFREFFRPDTIWENVGLTTTTGPEEAVALIKSYGARMPLVKFSVDMLAIAADGNVVLTERVDHVHDAEGAIVGSIRVMGALEVADGKIVRWRDYFNGSVAPA
jgi:limonene-1,2-epoxide hydrolase